LIDGGVEVWEYPGAIVHSKVVLADDQACFGTVDLDSWALYRDFELAMIVEDPATVGLFDSRLVEATASHRSALDHVIRTPNQGRSGPADAIRCTRQQPADEAREVSPTSSAGPAQIAQSVEQRTRNA
jgi:phosphatidylserine/phosphatidylglycerophosphate/cardiolipin synthase-like enzyme